MALPVAVVQMIRRWIVEVDGELDKSQAENTGVEIYVRLRIAGNGGDMVYSEQLFVHSVLLNIRFRNKRTVVGQLKREWYNKQLRDIVEGILSVELDPFQQLLAMGREKFADLLPLPARHNGVLAELAAGTRESLRPGVSGIRIRNKSRKKRK